MKEPTVEEVRAAAAADQPSFLTDMLARRIKTLSAILAEQCRNGWPAKIVFPRVAGAVDQVAGDSVIDALRQAMPETKIEIVRHE